jgi:predicted metal-dependent hydrolase
MPDAPLILALVHTPALHDAIERHSDGFRVEWSFEALGYEKANEKGRPQVAGVAELNPALIVIELDRPTDWLPSVHADPATRRIPIIGLAADADDSAKQRADAAHVNIVMTPEAFSSALPDVLAQYARVPASAEGLETGCAEPLPALVLKGIHEFNHHKFFECHETLEEAWNHERGPVREVYRAILQVGIAYYQIERKNYWGAHKMFLRVRQWFAPLPDHCQGIDIAQLRADSAAARDHLEALGPERIAEFDRSFLKPLHYQEPS